MKTILETGDRLKRTFCHLHLSLARFVETYSPISKQTGLLIGCYSIVIGLLNTLLSYLLNQNALALTPHWTLGYAPIETTYNAPLIFYLVIVFSVIGFGFAWLLLRLSPALKRFLILLSDQLLLLLFPLALLAFVPSTNYISRAYLVVGALLTLPTLIDLITSRHGSSPLITRSLPKRRRFFVGLALFIAITFSMGITTRSWYPVLLPHDYYEIEDSFQIPVTGALGDTHTIQAPRSKILDCLEADKLRNDPHYRELNLEQAYAKRLSELDHFPSQYLSVLQGDLGKQPTRFITTPLLPLPECHLDLPPETFNELLQPTRISGKWQIQAGRLFYHHSYLFVPAKHFLTYGFSTPVPYLYGIGNTLFYSLLMKASAPTISAYFATFPIGQLVGVLSFTLLAYYITRSFLGTLAGTSLLLIMMYSIGFESTLLAGGFSPLRYVGLLTQLASVFFLLRGDSFMRRFSIIAALAFSLFWNTEFAMFGLVMQAFALFSTTLSLSLARRIGWLIAALFVTLAGMHLVGLQSQGFLLTMRYVIFGLLPVPSNKMFVLFCVIEVFVLALLFYRAHTFKQGERAARFCLLPLFGLMMTKFLYTSSPVHLYFALMPVLASIPAFIDWKRPSARQDWRLYLVYMSTLLCLLTSVRYVGTASEFHKRLVLPYTVYQWSALGETFTTPTPSAPIESRMAAIQTQIKPEDRLIFLSPFDHLMSFYANPKYFCGHFEILTNLVTYRQNDALLQCARTEPNVLIVYDDALDLPCPASWKYSYYDTLYCGKGLVKENASSILKSLGDEAVLVKKIGSLSFYRMRQPDDAHAPR